MLKSVVLHRVRVPFVEPFRISNGVVAEKDAILIELTTDDGMLVGRSVADVRLVLLCRHAR
jgi:L-alanine-DL-glutamate epimerase-like enolase superfamily enzyme